MVFNEVIAGFHVLFNVIGLPGNLLVMVTIAFERFRIMRHVLLASLALSDFLCLILVNSFCILSTAQQNWLYGKTFCRLHPILVRYFYVNTALHLIAVSYERYNAIVKSPLTHSAAITSSRVVGIVLIWLLPTVVFISPVFGVWRYVQNVKLFLCEQAISSGSITIAIILLILGVVPFIIVVLLNRQVVKTARNLQRNSLALQIGSIEGSDLNQQQEMLSRHRELKAVVDVAIVIAVFTFCFLPGWALSVSRLYYENVPVAAILTTRCIFAASSVCNPLIYSIRKREFRSGVKMVLRRIGRAFGISFGTDSTIVVNNLACETRARNYASTATAQELKVIRSLHGRISCGTDDTRGMRNSDFEAGHRNSISSVRRQRSRAIQPLIGRTPSCSEDTIVVDNSTFEASNSTFATSLHKKPFTGKPRAKMSIHPIYRNTAPH